MPIDPANPLIVQSDRTIFLDIHAPKAGEARESILPFAELEKSPEHIHTYRITPLSLWNAGVGLSPADISRALNTYTRYPLPAGILEGFSDTMARYGKIVLLMLNLPFLRQAYKVYQELAFCVRQYSCLLIHAVCNFSVRSASRSAFLP